METAKALLSPAFSPALRQQLDKGLSFPAARQAALAEMGLDATLLDTPNNILAVEYCKAILSQGAAMEIIPILRQGDYHDTLADQNNPSATAVRQLMVAGIDFSRFIPEKAQPTVANAAFHTLQQGEKAILSRFRTMTDVEFEALPYGSEGLWRKLMHAARQENTLEDILSATKSKRYTRSRLDRMVMCAFLGLSAQDLSTPAPYGRVLALNDKGRQVLNAARETGVYPNIGEKLDHPYQAIEDRCDSLYGLFCAEISEVPTPAYRVYYQK